MIMGIFFAFSYLYTALDFMNVCLLIMAITMIFIKPILVIVIHIDLLLYFNIRKLCYHNYYMKLMQ